VDECKPLPVGLLEHGVVQHMHLRQGLTLVHFSAEPEPFLTQNAL